MTEPQPADGVAVVTTADELAAFELDWRELADNALEPNVFFEPWMLLPAMRRFGGDARFHVVLVWQQPNGPPRQGKRPLLAAVMPLCVLPATARMPLARLAMWEWTYSFLGAPLVRRGYAGETLAAIGDWLEDQRIARGPLELSRFPGDGPLHHAWLDELERREWTSTVAQRYTRAVLRPSGSADSYLAAAVSGKKRKELRRQHKRLREGGATAVETLPEGADDGALDAWIDDFCRLEAAGWKGQSQTAFASDTGHLSYFRDIVRGARSHGKLWMSRMTHSGRTIASKVSFVTGGQGFAYKIAFDEDYARFSPGVLLELDNLTRVCESGAVHQMDSCARSNHPMIDQLWMERRTIEHQLVAFNGRGDLLLSLLPLVRFVRRRACASSTSSK